MITGGEYWSRDEIPRNPTRIDENIPYLFPREVWPHEGSAVQATGYGLMVYLINNRLADSVPIMKWLQTMRNSIGGFASTRVSYNGS